MRRLLIILGVIALLIGGAIFFVTSALQDRRAERDAAALSRLPLRPVLPLLQLESGTPDLVVFEDGRDGWFELNTDTLPADLEIGFHGPRFFDLLTGNQHVPIYCTGPGKIIWAIRDGQIAQDHAFCNSRRMDLTNLRPFATPVEMITEQRTRAEIEVLSTAIATDPARALIASPQRMSDYSQRVVVTPPLMWFVTGSGPARHEVEASIRAEIQAQMGDVDVSFRRRPASNPNLALPEGEPQAGGGANMAMRQGDGYIVIPGVWAEPYEIWIECNPEVCAQAGSLELDAAFSQGRDLDALRRAIAAVRVAPRSDPPSPLEGFPDMNALEDTTVVTADPVPVTYQVRYITRP